VFHERERALKQRVVGQPDDDGIGDLSLASFVVMRQRHAYLRKFGKTDAEVDVIAGVVRAPALLFAPVAREHHAAEVEIAVEGGGGGKLRGRTTVEACPDSLGVNRSDASAKYADDGGECPDQPPAARAHGTLSSGLHDRSRSANPGIAPMRSAP